MYRGAGITPNACKVTIDLPHLSFQPPLPTELLHTLFVQFAGSVSLGSNCVCIYFTCISVLADWVLKLFDDLIFNNH